jgi:O-acetyl-ADP-ribose deacetylase (regulator of RNase III)
VTLVAAVSETVEKKVGRTVIRLRQGDLTALPVEAIVFYAREDLQLGAGFGTGIQSRGGAAVKQELDKIPGIKMGQAVITTAGNMNAQHIIHACGPKFQEADTEKKLRDCMQSALTLADLKRLKAVAFPPMGYGFYGVPPDVCSRAMLDSIKSFLQSETSLEAIIICVMDEREFEAFRGPMGAV